MNSAQTEAARLLEQPSWMLHELEDLAARLRDESDLCSHDGAKDIAALLDQAIEAVESYRAYQLYIYEIATKMAQR